MNINENKDIGKQLRDCTNQQLLTLASFYKASKFEKHEAPIDFSKNKEEIIKQMLVIIWKEGKLRNRLEIMNKPELMEFCKKKEKNLSKLQEHLG